MDKILLMDVLLGLSTGAVANEFIPYYGNNPFLFCSYGVPEDCWTPTHKETGRYRVTDRKCFNPWSARLYSRVFRQAFPNGAVEKSAPGDTLNGGSSSSSPYNPTDPNAMANLPKPAMGTVARDPADRQPFGEPLGQKIGGIRDMKTVHSVIQALIFVFLGTASAASAQTSNPYARPAPAPTAAKTAKGHAMDDLTTFATDGAKVLESVKGDLTGAGHIDVLLVLDPPARGDEKLGQGPNRNVVLLVRGETGQLQKAAANSHIVPCALCGGVSGDPYAYSKIGNGQFTIVVGGGSRERWADEYTFTYVSDKKNWVTSGVARKVTDTDTGQEKHLDLTTRELGTVLFSDFDPSHLPDPTLP